MISEIRNPNLAYLLVQRGYDFFIIDHEHGSYFPETISDIIAAARGAAISTVVRTPEIRRETILKPLDCGAAADNLIQLRKTIQNDNFLRGKSI